MKTKTYANLPNAYTAAEKAGAKQFDHSYEPTLVANCVGHAFKSKSACKVAIWNLVRYENTLCALEEVHAKDGKTAFKWTAIGHFDSDGLLYPMGAKQTENKPKKPTPRKPKGKPAPTPAEVHTTDWKADVDAYAGKGRKANKAVAKVLRKHNMSAQIGSEGWTYWEGIR